MHKVLLSFFSLLLIMQVHAMHFDQAVNIREIIVKALEDTNAFGVTVDVPTQTLQCYASCGRHQYLTRFRLKDMKVAFSSINKNSRKIKKFKRGKDLPTDPAALAQDHRAHIIETRELALAALLTEDIEKLATVCKALSEADNNWYGEDD